MNEKDSRYRISVRDHYAHLWRYAKLWWSTPRNLLGMCLCTLGAMCLVWLTVQEKKMWTSLYDQGKVYRQYQDMMKRVPPKLKERLISLCDKYKVPVALMVSLIDAESEWDANCVSGLNENGTRDFGLCQINSSNIDNFKRQFYSGRESFDVMNPNHNLEVSIRYLRTLYDAHGDWIDAVCAYNAGSYSVQTGNIPKSTKAYVRKIFMPVLWKC